MISKIVSGAQTGVDRGALDAAIEASCPYGGWIPKGRRSEDGGVPARYTALVESSSANYLKRTEQNVIDSDATLILCHGEPTGGTLRTVEFCKKHNRPCFIDDPDAPITTDRGMEVHYWIEAEFGMKPIVLMSQLNSHYEDDQIRRNKGTRTLLGELNSPEYSEFPCVVVLDGRHSIIGGV